MKYQSSNTKSIYELDFISGKRFVCPECAHTRKKEKNKDLQYFRDSNRAYCFHCNTTFFEYNAYEKKEYILPEWKNTTSLSDKAVSWFTGRGISQSTLVKMKIYSDTSFMPQFEKEVEVICFPYFANDTLVNIKYRGAQKSFKLHSGAKLVWYNYNAIAASPEVIICEGEIDALTFIENGFENVVSVPNGANKNLQYLDDSILLFDKKKIILATDNDPKGIELRDELIRRFGAESCYLLNFKECKDANEFYMKYHGFEFKDMVKKARQVPVEGNIEVNSFYSELEDLFENGMQRGATLSFEEIDRYISWETKRLAIVTGRPGAGKSEFVDYIVSKLNIVHGWKACYFTPENYPLKYHYSKIYEKFIGKPFARGDSTQLDFDMAYEYINDNFFYILPENDLTVEKVLTNARLFIKSKGIKILVIDPYNKLDHQQDARQTETQYISKFLDTITTFAKMNDILIFLVAHPTKLDSGQIPTLYSISGSANFYNKTDYGFTVHRVFDDSNMMTNDIEIHWQKIKFKHLGEQGISQLRYNYKNGRFEKRNSIDNWDNRNWLVPSTDGYTYFEPMQKDVPF
jgi:twinkle protein